MHPISWPLTPLRRRARLRWPARLGCAVCILGVQLIALGCASSGSSFATPWSKNRESEWQTRKDFWAPDRVSQAGIRNGFMRMIGQGPNQEIAQEAYDDAERLFKEERYADASWKFRKAIRRWPDSTLEEDARFWLGESYFFQNKYAAANGAFNELVKKYPNTQYMDVVSDRRFSLADFWLEQHRASPWNAMVPNMVDRKRPAFDTRGNALKNYQYILESDSIGPLADDAVMRLANAYFVSTQYNDAAEYYDMVRTQYPQSAHVFDAYRLGIQCELRRYQGPEYTGTPLERAEILLEEMAVMFPDRMQEQPEELERLEYTRGLVKVEQARRDLELAKYYDRTKHFGAARRYYEDVTEKHSGTPVAEAAKSRLEEIADRPAHPTNVATRVASLWPWTEREDSEASTPGDNAKPEDGGEMDAEPKQERTLIR